MWTDEAATWVNSIQPIHNIIGNSKYVDVIFLPYYLFMHVWLGVSQSLWWMRLPSLIIAAVTVEMLVLLARRWLPFGWSVLAGFLLALNPMFAEWSIEARPYTAATLFAVLSMAALVGAINRGSTFSWVRYGLASVCMLLLQLIAAFVLVAQVAAVALSRRWSALRAMVLALAGVAIAVSPLVIVAKGETRQISWIPAATIRTFPHALLAVSGGPVEAAGLVIGGIILATAFASAAPGSETALSSALCLAWGALPPLLLILVSFLHPLYVDRYVLVSVPGIALIEAMAARRVWTILTAQRRTRSASEPLTQASSSLPVYHHDHGQRRPAVVAAVALVGACAVALALLVSTGDVLRQRYVVEDYRSAAATLSSDLRDHPAPVAVIPNWAGVGFSYYTAPPTFAHALIQQEIGALNRHMLDWQAITLGSGSKSPEPILVMRWPIGPKAVTATGRCPVRWAVGRGTVPLGSFIIDGSRCELSGARHYGDVWVASAGS